MSKYNSLIYYTHIYKPLPPTPSIVLKNVSSKLLVIVFFMMMSGVEKKYI